MSREIKFNPKKRSEFLPSGRRQYRNGEWFNYTVYHTYDGEKIINDDTGARYDSWEEFEASYPKPIGFKEESVIKQQKKRTSNRFSQKMISTLKIILYEETESLRKLLEYNRLVIFQYRERLDGGIYYIREHSRVLDKMYKAQCLDNHYQKRLYLLNDFWKAKRYRDLERKLGIFVEQKKGK